MAAESPPRTFVSSEGGFSAANLRKYEKPRGGYQETAKMREVLNLVKENRNKVIHIHGMPGSGKSQIVAAVCKHMDEKGYIEWHVQCQQGTNKLKDGWSMFVERLYQEGIVTEADKAQILNAMNSGVGQSMRKFIDKCIGIECPIIFAVELEDADDEESRVMMADERTLLRYFIGEIPSYFGEVLKVQLLLASRHQDILYSQTDLAAMDFYKTSVIEGFTKEESKNFLVTPEIEYTEPKLMKLAEELAYSPLGLLLAKSYCQEYKMSYDHYCDLLGEDERITSKEKELLSRHPDLGKHHRYEVIMRLLSPKETDGEDKHYEFKVMKMVSFLNKNNIPSQIFESFFRIVKPGKTVDIKTSTAHLFRNLERYVGANREKSSEEGSGNEFISLHGDILRVLNASMGEDEEKEVLSDVVNGVLLILDKDNVRPKDNRFLYEMKDHIVQIALRCSDLLRPLERDGGVTVKDYEIMLDLSRINELIGFAIAQHPGSRKSNEEDGYYQKAMEYLWAAVIFKNDSSLLSTLVEKLQGKKENNLDLLVSYKEGKDPKKTAEEVFKRTKEMVKSNIKLQNALFREFQRNFQVKEKNLADVKKKVGENAEIDWDLVTKELKEEGRISENHQQQLIENGAILEWKKLIKIYVVERMASILHSRGRQDNYKADLLKPDMFVKCQWWTEFGFCLCDVAYEKIGVKSMFHFILRANNKIPRLIRSKEGESDNECERRLMDVRETALSLKDEQGDFYEHGIYKEVSGTPRAVLNALKYVVKANTKVHKRPVVLRHYPIAKADAEVEELYQLAVDNKKIAMSTTCLVHAGKYYAARENYGKAIDTFKLAFANGIDKEEFSNSTRYAWALYNTLRAISKSRVEISRELRSQMEERLMRTERNNTPDKWKTALGRIKREALQIG